MMPTNFNAVPDPDGRRLVMAPPPEDSVAPELVEQFIRQNRISDGNAKQCAYELYRVPADKWLLISTYLSTTCQNKINSLIVGTLSKMSIEMLNLVIDFARERNITDVSALRALSKVRTEEFRPFVQLIEAQDLLQSPKIWEALAAMPAQYREDFIHFCKEKQYHMNGLKGGLIFQHHTPESWPEIDNFLNNVIGSLFLALHISLRDKLLLHLIKLLCRQLYIAKQSDEWQKSPLWLVCLPWCLQ